MTTATKDEGKLTLGWLTKSSAKLFRRVLDFQSFQGARIAALEDRLAKLDGRDDAKAASRAALSAVNIANIARGDEPLCFKVVDDTTDDQRLVWADSK